MAIISAADGWRIWDDKSVLGGCGTEVFNASDANDNMIDKNNTNTRNTTTKTLIVTSLGDAGVKTTDSQMLY